MERAVEMKLESIGERLIGSGPKAHIFEQKQSSTNKSP